MKCQQCQQIIPDGTRFCPYCGAVQNAAPSPAMPPPPPIPSYQPPKPAGKGISTKAILIIALILFVLFVGASVAVWFIFFPPGVYVRDNFSKVHPDLETQVQELNAEVKDGVVSLKPGNEKFQALLYHAPASKKSTIETTVLLKEGDESTMFGVVCCAKDDKNFTVFMIKANGIYSIYQYLNSEWFSLAIDLHLPKDMKIVKNTPYKLKVTMEDEYMNLFVNDILMARIFDSYGEHAGRTGVYAQGGKAGTSVISFDTFEAKKNSLFQKD